MSWIILLWIPARASATMCSISTWPPRNDWWCSPPEPASLTDAYALIKMLKLTHGVEHFKVCVNMAPDLKTAKDMFIRLHQACDHFLSGVSLDLVGVIPRDTGVRKAVVQQLPFCVSEPQSPAAKAVYATGQKH